MKFKKEFLLHIPANDIISDEIYEHHRWAVSFRLIFKFDNKYYETVYRVGATEMQDESPYEYEPDEIECKEVFKLIKMMTVYE